MAHNAFELRALVRLRPRPAAIPYVILGRGSNLVISDAGIRGLVIHARAEASRVEGDRYHAEAGVPMARAATETQQAGLTGLEFGLAIPGTVGGAVWANAGAHGGDTAGVLESAMVLLADGTERELPAAELGFSYRHSRFKDAAARPGRGGAGGDRHRDGLPAAGRGPGRDPPRAWTRSAAGGASTSPWASRRPAASSGTRPGTPRAA